MGVNASIRSLDALDDRERRAAVRLFLRRGYASEYGILSEDRPGSAPSTSSFE